MTIAEVALIAIFPIAFLAAVGLLTARGNRKRVITLEDELLELQYDLGVKERPEFGVF